MSTKRVSPEDSIYPPKKRALFEHKRQEELLKKENGKSNSYDSTNDFLAMKMKLESSQTDLICMRPRSDSLQSMQSLISDHLDQSSSTGSREPSPNIFDSRTPERNPVEFYKPEISKPLFPDLWKHDSDVYNEGLSEKMSLQERKESINSEIENESNQSNNNPNLLNSRMLILDKNFNELTKYEAQKEQNVTGISSEGGSNQSQTATLHLSEQTVLTKDSMYVGPMVSLISRFNQEAVKNHLNSDMSNIVPSISDFNDREKELNSEVEKKTQNITNISMADCDMFKCRICDKKFKVHDHLKEHMQEEHSGPLPYKCQHCPRAFGQYNNLQRHLRVHRAKIYKCKLCEREFNEEFYLKMHMGTHTGKRVYSCGVCSASFSSNQDLKLHVKTHSPSQLHTCDVCGKSFSKACVLRQHKKGHSGERPHKCDKCPKTFIHRHHLTMHLKSHTEEKQYTCEICKKEFYQSSHLYKHLKSHEEGQNHIREVSVKNEKPKIDDAFSKTINKQSKEEKSTRSNDRVLNETVCENLPWKNEHVSQRGIFPANVSTTLKLPSLSEAFYPGHQQANLPINENPYGNHGQQISMAYCQPISIQQSPYYPFQQQNAHSAMNSQRQAFYDYVYVKQMIEKVKHGQTDNSKYGNILKLSNRPKDYIVKQQTSARDHIDKQVNTAKEYIVKQPNKPNGSSERSVVDKKEKFEADISTSEAAVELIKMSGSVRDLNESINLVTSLHGRLRHNENSEISGGHKQAVQPSDQMQSTNNETLNLHRPFQPSSVNTVMSSIYAAPTSLASLYYGQSQAFNQSFLSSETQQNYPKNLHYSIIPRHYPLNRQYPYYNIGLAQYQNSQYQPMSSLWGGQEQRSSQHLPLNLTSPNSPKKRHYSSQDVNILKEKPSNDVSSNHIFRQRHLSESLKTNTDSHSLSYLSSTIDVSPAAEYDMEGLKKGKIRHPKIKFDLPERTTYSNNYTDSPESTQSFGNNKFVEGNHTAIKIESIENANIDTEIQEEFDKNNDVHSEKVIGFGTSAETSSFNDYTKSLTGNDTRVDLSTKVQETELRNSDNALFYNSNEENNRDTVPVKESFNVSRESYVDKDNCADRVKDAKSNATIEENIPMTDINLNSANENNFDDKTTSTSINDTRFNENAEINSVSETEAILKQHETCDDTVTEIYNVSDNLVSNNITSAIHDNSGALDLSLKEQNQKIQDEDNEKENDACNVTERTNVEHGSNDGGIKLAECVRPKVDKMSKAQIPDKISSSDVFNMCGICWKKFDNSTDLQMHQIDHAQKLEISNNCHICGRTFAKSFDLQCHIMKHRQESLNTIKLNGYLSPLVGNKIIENGKNQSEFRNQSRAPKGDKENEAKALQTGSRHHSKFKAGMLSNTMKSNIENQPTQKSSSYGFNKLDKMNGLNVDHSITKQIGFGVVKQSLSSDENTRQTNGGCKTSEMEQNSKRYKCEICLRDFAHKHNLARHKMSHNQKSFKCSFCDRTFKEKFYLQMHEKTHTDESLLDCEICGETVQKVEYWRHANEHFGIIEKNPTYEQIGHRVKELLNEKQNNENLISKIDTRKVLGERKENVLDSKTDTRKVLGERKENVLDSKARNSNVVKSLTGYGMTYNEMSGNEENIEHVTNFFAKNYLFQNPTKRMNHAFKLKN